MITNGYFDLKNMRILEVDLWHHFEAIKNYFPNDSEIEYWWNQLDDVEESCAKLEAEEGHGEWHHYEIVQDEAMYEINKILQSRDILRFNIQSGGGRCYIDADPERFWANDLRSKLRKLIEDERLAGFTKIEIYFGTVKEEPEYVNSTWMRSTKEFLRSEL